HYRKSKYCEVSCPTATPAAGNPHMQVSCINQPGDGGPGLFRIPAPIRTPGTVCPVRAGGNHQGEQGKGDADCLVGDLIQGFSCWKQTFQVMAPPEQHQVQQ